MLFVGIPVPGVLLMYTTRFTKHVWHNVQFGGSLLKCEIQTNKAYLIASKDCGGDKNLSGCALAYKAVSFIQLFLDLPYNVNLQHPDLKIIK